MKLLNIRALSIVAMMLFVSSAWANVGKALYTIGNVTIEKPAVTKFKRGDIIEEGDEIVTGPKGYAQLKLLDGTKIAIRPNSRFVVEALEAPATATRPAIGAGTRLNARFNLKKGGFRTITGRISKRDPSAYQLTTPSAIIGVRGTNFVARICSGDCSGTDDGLYVGVSNGGVSMTNDGGSLTLGKNQFGFAASFTAPPTRLIAPPSSLSDDGLALVEEESDDEDDSSDDSSGSDSSDDAAADSDGGSDGGSDGDSDSASMAADRGGDVSSDAAAVAASDAGPAVVTTGAIDDGQAEQDIVAEGPNGGEVDLGGGGGDELFVSRALSFSTTEAASGVLTDDNTASFDTNNSLISFVDINDSNQIVAHNIGTGVNKNVGFDSNSQLRWGRWADGTATQSVGGVQTNVDLATNGLHWIVGDENDAVPTQVITGSASYVLVGNTDPTDNLGNVGVLGSASFSADFTNSTVNSNLQLGINNQVWTASGTGTISAINTNLFNGLYSTVTVDGTSGGSGSFGGLFAGYGSDASIPAGAGLNYNLSNGTTTVNGAAIFNTTTTGSADQ